eukprot:scaffold75978_cov19-Tisochrysis_lutea.AAC.1
MRPGAHRWTLCATDRCFKYAGLSELFTAMKVLPVQRGAGMKQPGLAAAESRVAAGHWVSSGWTVFLCDGLPRDEGSVFAARAVRRRAL